MIREGNGVVLKLAGWSFHSRLGERFKTCFHKFRSVQYRNASNSSDLLVSNPLRAKLMSLVSKQTATNTTMRRKTFLCFSVVRLSVMATKL